jgi:hypothetical protein
LANLAYRWFCKLGIEDAIPDHSAFSRARNERFCEGDVWCHPSRKWPNKRRNTHREQIFSGLPLKPDMAGSRCHVRKVPMD